MGKLREQKERQMDAIPFVIHLLKSLISQKRTEYLHIHLVLKTKILMVDQD